MRITKCFYFDCAFFSVSSVMKTVLVSLFWPHIFIVRIQLLTSRRYFLCAFSAHCWAFLPLLPSSPARTTSIWAFGITLALLAMPVVKPLASSTTIANITTVKGHVLHGLSPDSMHFTHVLYVKWRLSQKRAGRSTGTLDRMIEIEKQRTCEDEATK